MKKLFWLAIFTYTSLSQLELAQEVSFVISGQAENYASDELKLVGYTFDGGQVVGTGQLQSDGSFTFSLPETLPKMIEAIPFDTLWCSDFEVTPEKARGRFLYVLGTEETAPRPGGLVLASSLEAAKTLLNDTGDRPITLYAVAAWLYVDRDVTIQGTCQTTIPQQTDLNLKKGWTMLVTEVDQETATIVTTSEIELNWYWLEP
jgi:hypothetical protein